MRRRALRLITMAAVPAFVLGACNSSTPTPETIIVTQAPATPPAPGTTATVRWFVGLDPLGTEAAQVNAEKAFVANYNAVNKAGILIKLEVVPSAVAADRLRDEMAAGNSPDIIGPVGVGSRSGFDDLLLDLSSEIHNNNVDLSAYDPALLRFLQVPDGGQIGLPYLISPGFIWYNKDIFAKAGLPALPTKVGDQYNGQDWTWATLGKLAAQLTQDKTGKKATDAGFDKANIVKYGMDFQGADMRRVASLFGGGTFLASDGKTAQIPATWADGMNWFYSAMWTGHYVPSATAESSDVLAEGNSMSSGNLAMNAAWSSGIGSIAASAASSKVKSWDIGVIPSWKGNTTSPLDADTFSITKASKNPDAAFKVMLAITADATLLKSYGREPAKTADQAAYFTALDASLASIFPGNHVDWSVLTEMAKVPAIPSDEAALPADVQATSDYTAFFTKLQTTAGVDVNGELTKLQATLQADFDGAQPLVNQ